MRKQTQTTGAVSTSPGGIYNVFFWGQIPWQEQNQAFVLTDHWQQSSGGQQLNLDGGDQLPLG